MGLNKPMTVGGISAFGAGLLFHLILPTVLGVVLASVISGLTLLDPLYAGDRTKSTWLTLSTILIIQLLHTVITATGVGVVNGYLAPRLQSLWLYPVGALVSITLHYLLLFIFAIGFSVFSANETSGPVWGISIAITSVVAPIIGLTSVFAIRWWGT